MPGGDGVKERRNPTLPGWVEIDNDEDYPPLASPDRLRGNWDPDWVEPIVLEDKSDEEGDEPAPPAPSAPAVSTSSACAEERRERAKRRKSKGKEKERENESDDSEEDTSDEAYLLVY